MRAEDSMMHTILKFFKYRWLITQNIAHFPLAKNHQNFQKF